MRHTKIPISYSKIIGTANMICDNTSGGVTTAAMMNDATIRYGRAAVS